MAGIFSATDEASGFEMPYAPCLGEGSLYPTTIIEAALPVVGTLAEFFLAYDVVLPDTTMGYRGVAAHEYAHTVMCSLMRDVGEQEFFAIWSDVIIAALTTRSDPNSQPSYIAEGFADYLATHT